MEDKRTNGQSTTRRATGSGGNGNNYKNSQSRPGSRVENGGKAENTSGSASPAPSFGARVSDGIKSVFGKTDNVTERILHKGSIDIPLLVIFSLLIAIGVLMVFSASYAYSFSEEKGSYFYVKKQLVFLLIGLGISLFIIFLFDIVMTKSALPWLVRLYFLGIFGLLILVLLIGTSEGEAKRWIYFGSFGIQPSEFMKGALIMFLALYYSRREKQIYESSRSFFAGTLAPILVSVPVIFLVFLENHVSGVIILGLIILMMVFFGEKKHGFLITVTLAGLAVVVIVISFLLSVDKESATGVVGKIVNSYAWKRIDMWLRPENFNIRDDLWQSTQGLYAIGSGGFMGVGFGQSRQKHLFVSQPQNDFIFTILCEELGFIGAVIVIALFALLIWRGIVIGSRIPDTFSRLTVWGLTVSMGLQAYLNIAVVTGILPNTGISLPFFSYGGSSMLSIMIEAAIVLALSRYAYKTT